MKEHSLRHDQYLCICQSPGIQPCWDSFSSLQRAKPNRDLVDFSSQTETQTDKQLYSPPSPILNNSYIISTAGILITQHYSQWPYVEQPNKTKQKKKTIKAKQYSWREFRINWILMLRTHCLCHICRTGCVALLPYCCWVRFTETLGPALLHSCSLFFYSVFVSNNSPQRALLTSQSPGNTLIVIRKRSSRFVYLSFGIKGETAWENVCPSHYLLLTYWTTLSVCYFSVHPKPQVFLFNQIVTINCFAFQCISAQNHLPFLFSSGWHSCSMVHVTPMAKAAWLP